VLPGNGLEGIPANAIVPLGNNGMALSVYLAGTSRPGLARLAARDEPARHRELLAHQRRPPRRARQHGRRDPSRGCCAPRELIAQQELAAVPDASDHPPRPVPVHHRGRRQPLHPGRGRHGEPGRPRADLHGRCAGGLLRRPARAPRGRDLRPAAAPRRNDESRRRTRATTGTRSTSPRAGIRPRRTTSPCGCRRSSRSSPHGPLQPSPLRRRRRGRTTTATPRTRPGT
jgi:hypothetical protein